VKQSPRSQGGDCFGTKTVPRNDTLKFLPPTDGAPRHDRLAMTRAGHLDIEDARREYLAVRSLSGLFPDNRHFFVEVKNLVRPKPNLKVAISERDDGTYEVRVATDVYAYFVKLVVSIEGTKFSDNYFDLFPGQERVIEVWNEAGRRLEENDIAVSCL